MENMEHPLAFYTDGKDSKEYTAELKFKVTLEKYSIYHSFNYTEKHI